MVSHILDIATDMERDDLGYISILSLFESGLECPYCEKKVTAGEVYNMVIENRCEHAPRFRTIWRIFHRECVDKARALLRLKSPTKKLTDCQQKAWKPS